MNLFFGTAGSKTPRILIVGESWGREEDAHQTPFIGQSGKELFRELSEALGWNDDLLQSALGASSFSDWKTRRNDWLELNQIMLANVIDARPANNDMWRFFYSAKEAKAENHPTIRGLHPMPNIIEGLDKLYALIEATKPELIICLGNYSLWALTNCATFSTKADSQGRRTPNGITKWRGSMWHVDAGPEAIHGIKLLPIIHPAAILNAWYQRAPTVHDFRERIPMGLSNDWRANPEPTLLAPPTFDQAQAKLNEWLVRMICGEKLRILNDIETFPARGLITCLGFADSEHFAMVIPLVKLDGKEIVSFWSAKEERILADLIRLVLSHPNCEVEGQNYVYDTQWIQEWLGISPRLAFDSMLAHHLLFPGTPKGLDYLSSLYCKYHWYWKDDNKDWDLKGDLATHLIYNATDCIRNYEINTVLRGLIPVMGQEVQWEEEKEVAKLALRMMNRGVRIDKAKRAFLALELSNAALEYEAWFEKIFPQSSIDPNPKVSKWFRSPKQLKELCLDLGIKLPNHRKTGQPTLGKESFALLKEKHPEFSRLFDALKDYRSLGVFVRNFIRAPLDFDGRMRCSFNTAGTETFRWSSSENAFGRGTNLQNLPKGDEK